MPGLLGRAIKNNINKRKVEQKIKNGDISSRNRNIESYAADPDQGLTKKTASSVCETDSVDTFLANVSRSHAKFSLAGDVDHISLIKCKNEDKALKKDIESARIDFLNEEVQFYSDAIQVIRRPKCSRETETKMMLEAEEEAFIDWKRDLAFKFEESELIITPYEKNLDVWRQLWRVVEKSDCLVQIVDARNPLLFWCADLVNYARETHPDGQSLLLINKSDLLCETKIKAWKSYFDQTGVVFAFFSAKNSSAESEVSAKEAPETIDGAEKAKMVMARNICAERVLSVKDVIEVLEAIAFLSGVGRENGVKAKKGGFGDESGSFANKTAKARYVVGMVGFPNVGKSSVINALFGSKKTSVAATPGKTKHFQTLVLSDSVELCDCPGLVFPTLLNSRAELICSGIINADHCKNLLDSVDLVCSRVSIDQFLRVYKGIHLPVNRRFTDRQQVLESLCNLRKWLNTCKVPNVTVAARQIIKDYVAAEILFCFPPPALSQQQKLDFYDRSAFEETDADDGKQSFFGEFAPNCGPNALLVKGEIPMDTVYDEKLGSSKRKHKMKERLFRRIVWKELNSERRNLKMASNEI